MLESLDEIFKTKHHKKHVDDAVESKLFGLGLESYTVVSHEFVMGYAITQDKTYCLDMGYFHPTEYVGDKISVCLQYIDKLLLHLSRDVRWDSDHVVVLDDELHRIMWRWFVADTSIVYISRRIILTLRLTELLAGLLP